MSVIWNTTISAPDDGSQRARLMRTTPANAAQISIFAVEEPAILERFPFDVNRSGHRGFLRTRKSD